MIRATDGLDYEDITARLVGEPAETFRNKFLLGRAGSKDKDIRGWYLESYDAWQARGYGDHECDRAAVAQVDRNLDAQRYEHILRAELAGRRGNHLAVDWGQFTSVPHAPAGRPAGAGRPGAGQAPPPAVRPTP